MLILQLLNMPRPFCHGSPHYFAFCISPQLRIPLTLCKTLPPEAGVRDDGDEKANHGDSDSHDGDETQGQGRAVSLAAKNFDKYS